MVIFLCKLHLEFIKKNVAQFISKELILTLTIINKKSISFVNKEMFYFVLVGLSFNVKNNNFQNASKPIKIRWIRTGSQSFEKNMYGIVLQNFFH